MRVLLILGGIGILGAAAWAVTADEGGHGHGSSHWLSWARAASKPT